MLAALALAFQLAVAAPTPAGAPAQLLVRANGRDATVPVVPTNVGPAVRADLVAASLGGCVKAKANGHWDLSFPGVTFDVAEQVPFARVGGDVVPLASAPFREGDRLFVPFQLVAEHLPARGTGIIYDARLGELRVFTSPTPGTFATARPRDDDAAPVTRPRASGSTQRQNPRAGARDDGRELASLPVRAATGAVRLRERRRVVIDAGHGGVDAGMSGPIGRGPKIQEKDITLAVSRRLAAALRERGVDVVMTRTADTLIGLYDRGPMANRSKADLFISVHVNAANMKWKSPGAARGYETYFLAEAKTEDARRVERMENEAVRFETDVDASKGDPLSFIINDMAQNEHLRESSDLASSIQQGLGTVHPAPSRGVKQANFAVLRTAYMPAVLVELGFGTNPDDARLLASAREQQRMADAIAEATLQYLVRYERRVAGGSR
jgi:N-acetylmuramoyl-L-alanine amidase